MAVNLVLDSSAMLAYLNAEPGGNDVTAHLTDPNAVCHAHAMNLCEVYYISERRSGVQSAETAIQTLKRAGVLDRSDMDAPLWKVAASLKAKGGIALPDCFCVALALRVGGTVVTADRNEFTPLVNAGVVPVQFIR